MVAWVAVPPFFVAQDGQVRSATKEGTEGLEARGSAEGGKCGGRQGCYMTAEKAQMNGLTVASRCGSPRSAAVDRP